MGFEEMLDDHENRIKKLEELLIQNKESNLKFKEKPLSLKEFLLSKNPTNDVARTIMIAYFLEKYNNLEEWLPKDIVEGFKSAKESVPGNISDKIQKGVHKGLIMLSNKGHYKLTNSGDAKVENGFSKK